MLYRICAVRLGWLVLFVACHAHASDGPPCSAVAGSFFLIARGELEHAGVPDDVRRAVTEQLPAMRDSLAQLCTGDVWSAAARQCVVQAADHAALQACEAGLTADQRAALDDAQRSARPETSSP
jgi:hypothetical protein